MVKKLMFGIVCCVLFGISGCVKQTAFPPYPILTSIQAGKTSDIGIASQPLWSDSILITLGFTDGEGGIGPVQLSTDPDSLPLAALCNHAYDSLIISDPFYNVYWYTYHSPSISTDSCLNYTSTSYVPDNPANPSIKGTIQIYPAVECPPTSNPDTIYYSFFIKDRNGKISNRMRTPPIIVSCQ